MAETNFSQPDVVDSGTYSGQIIMDKMNYAVQQGKTKPKQRSEVDRGVSYVRIVISSAYRKTGHNG